MRNTHNTKHTQNKHIIWYILISTQVEMSWAQTAVLIAILQTSMNKTDTLKRKWTEWEEKINLCCSACNIRANYCYDTIWWTWCILAVSKTRNKEFQRIFCFKLCSCIMLNCNFSSCITVNCRLLTWQCIQTYEATLH